MKVDIEWNNNAHVALCISGGVDSMVLYDVLMRNQAFSKLTLLHVNHGIRNASNDEAAYIKSLAQQNQHQLIIKELHFNRFTQESARDARYEFFFQCMKNEDIDVLLTAHHKDDDVETVMFQLLTGREITGIVSPSRKDKRIYRPLLNVTKEELYQYSHNYGVKYFEDESNASNEYTRNYIRNQVLEAVNAHEDLSGYHILSLKEDVNDYVTLLKEKRKLIKNNQIEIDAFLNQPFIVQRDLIQNMIGMHLSRKFVKEIIYNIQSKTKTSYEFGENLLCISYTHIFMKEKHRLDEPFTITAVGTYTFNSYVIKVKDVSILPLNVRSRKEGDRVKLRNGSKKVNRLMIDKKIPKNLREEIPIITQNTCEIIAVGEIYNIMNEKERSIQVIRREHI